jgi:hypothetical protein
MLALCTHIFYIYIYIYVCISQVASHFRRVTIDLPILIAAAAAVSVSLAASDGATLSLISASCTQWEHCVDKCSNNKGQYHITQYASVSHAIAAAAAGAAGRNASAT